MVSKLEKMQKYLPSIYRPKNNPNIRGLLHSFAQEDDNIVTAIQDAKDQIFVLHAQLQYLDALGSNVGVFRPTEFNLADILYRQLIPALSYAPKQVTPTIKRVLGIFFGENNPRVSVSEINPNQIKISIPSSVPSLRRALSGSHHFHNYSGEIVSVDNSFKEMTVDLDGDSKDMKSDELENALIGQGNNVAVALGNTQGTSSLTIQFSAAEDLSGFVVGQKWMAAVPNYQGGFIPDPTRAFSLTKNRGILGQAISTGDQISTLTMQEASGIPDEQGFIAFNFGSPTQEILIKYFGRPNNSTLLIDPSYVFTEDHAIGESINVVKTPYLKPRSKGQDYSVYIVGVEAARELAQKIVESIAAAGVVIEWEVLNPIIDC